LTTTAWQIAVVGAGPVGLALALYASRVLPQADITVFDARPADRDVAADPRTLALSLGSVQLLQQLGVWPEVQAHAQPIAEVQVSQAPPTLATSWGTAEVTLTAADLGQAQLGAVLSYGALVAPLQRAWQARISAEPHRLRSRFGAPVLALKPLPEGVELDAGIAERFDLAVVAEGGVFAEQARKALVRDYAQTAWVGTATLTGAARGVAFERFTRDGPLALLPLLPPSSAPGTPAPATPQATPTADTSSAALVWCVSNVDDPVRPLDTAQRIAVLNTLLPPRAGRLIGLSALKDFPLGLNAERTLVSGRTVRIGNAAQTLHPVAGQGLNLGLRDAHELVAKLRWARDIDSALRQTEWARAGDRWAMIATTDFLARSFTWTLPGAATARGLGLAALQAAPPVQRWLARRMMFGSR
jgi:2-octaprenyl-6-methoxyphenol hydroxylase